MRLLGAILAGGQATRFGSDKAHVIIDGTRLLDAVAHALSQQTDALIVCGREDPAYTCLPDRPEPGLGPLGGLSAALAHAKVNGFDAVLSSGCDAFNLPVDLASNLAGEGPAIAQSQPVIGLWPAALSGTLDAFLANGGRALYGFAERVEARSVQFDPPIANMNSPEDVPRS